MKIVYVVLHKRLWFVCDNLMSMRPMTDEQLVQIRLQELWLRRLSAPACAPHLLGTPSNVLASNALDWCPEWHLQYRVAWDGLAYSRAEFKSYYGWERFRAYWAAALEATAKQKHVAVLRSICDQLRMRKVAAAFRTHTRFDDAIIDNIASFVHVSSYHGGSVTRWPTVSLSR